MEYEGISVKTQGRKRVTVWNPSAPFYMQNDNAFPTAKKNFLRQIERLKGVRDLEDHLIAERLAWEKTQQLIHSEIKRVVIERVKEVGP